MATQADARSEYDQYLSAKGATDQGDFDNLWKNASADSGLMQGADYQKTWGDVWTPFQKTIDARMASNGGGNTTQPSPGWGGNAMSGFYNAISAQSAADQQKNTERGDTLFQTLMDRINQTKNVDRNDPIIRSQADAYNANTARAARDHMDSIAEQAGPLGSVRNENRLTSERAGQANAANEAGLVGSELKARRDEIQNALTGALGFVDADKQRTLQAQLAQLDAQIKNRGLDLQDKGLTQTNDLGLRSLGLQDWDRQMYYDMVQRGVL